MHTCFWLKICFCNSPSVTHHSMAVMSFKKATKAAKAIKKAAKAKATKASSAGGADGGAAADGAACVAGGAAEAGDFGWGGWASTWFQISPRRGVALLMVASLVPSDALPLREEFRQLVYASLE